VFAAITGVATSITAFVGRALRGPTDADEDSPFTVSIATAISSVLLAAYGWGARLVCSKGLFLNAAASAHRALLSARRGAAERATMSINGLDLEAASPGAWGNQLRVRIDHDTRTCSHRSGKLSLQSFS